MTWGDFLVGIALAVGIGMILVSLLRERQKQNCCSCPFAGKCRRLKAVSRPASPPAVRKQA